MNKVEFEEVYKGFCIRCELNQLGHRCGYVKVPEESRLYGVYHKNINVDVHGGLTYSGYEKEEYWLGFDCGHINDAADYDALKEYGMYTQAIAIGHRLSARHRCMETIRTLEFVKQECYKLVDGLIWINAELVNVRRNGDSDL